MQIIGSTEQFAQWSKHYNAVKSKIIPPKKGSSVQVQTKKGDTYSFKYINLAGIDRAIEDAVNKVVDKDGFPYINYTIDSGIDIDGVWAETIVLDSSGCAVKLSKIWFKSANIGRAQNSAALLSYAKRYSLAASFGIANDDEEDSQRRMMQEQSEPQPHALTKRELDDYQINYSGRRVKLADLMDEAVNGDKDAQAFIKAQQDPQDIIAIKQLSETIKKAKPAPQPKPQPAPKPIAVDQVDDLLAELK